MGQLILTTNIFLIYIQFGKISFGSEDFEYDVMYNHKIQYKKRNSTARKYSETKIKTHFVFTNSTNNSKLK